jgi:SAM-dependent methyltransferase
MYLKLLKQLGNFFMQLINAIKKNQSFEPNLLGILLNPAYIYRKGVYKHIKSFSTKINGDVLDFGCGSMPYLNLFKNVKTYIGCEIKNSGYKNESNIENDFYDGTILPYKYSSFDAVVSFEVFEHVFNLPEILLEINRVLKPNGYLLATTPFCWGEHEVPNDFARYTSYGIAHLLKQSGFEVIELNRTSTYTLAIFQTIINYIYHTLIPDNKLFYLFQLTIIFPLTAIALFINAIMPDNERYYAGIAVLATKSSLR